MAHLAERKYDVSSRVARRTDWPFRQRKILNLKSFEKLEGLDIRPLYSQAEIHELGPYLAAPVLRSPNGRVEGVVRAVRRKGSTFGPFTAGHEFILSACSPTLAAVVQRAREPQAVVISYSDHALAEDLSRYLKAVGYEPLFLHRPNDVENPPDEFRKLADRASAGIVVLTADKDDGTPSQNVIAEAAQLMESRANRTIVLRERRAHRPVSLPLAADGETEFDKTLGMREARVIAQKLAKWLRDG